MVAQVRYEPDVPEPVNLLENLQGGSPRRWLTPYVAIKPISCLVFSLCWAVLVLNARRYAGNWNTDWDDFDSINSFLGFWYACVCLLICATLLFYSLRFKLQDIPKVWKRKAEVALEKMDKDSVVLVLNCGVGASAIPFAQEAVRTGKADRIQFVCIDDFSPLSSFPYHPKVLLQNLVDVGVSPRSVTAHRLTKNKTNTNSPVVHYNSLPFASGSISLIICDKPLLKGVFKPGFDYECLQEGARILRPGGRLILQDTRPAKTMASVTERMSSQTVWMSVTTERAVYREWIDLIKSDTPNYMSMSISDAGKGV